MTLLRSTTIFVCGWPMSGKTSLAKKLCNEIGVHHVDIDEVRWLMIGKPYPHPDESPDLMKQDGQEMGGAYRFLFDVIAWHLEQGRSILATATLSSKPNGQEKLRTVFWSYPNAAAKIIQCVPEGDTPETVAALIAKRDFGENGYKGAVNSPERYFEVKNRFHRIELSHIEIATWGSKNTIEDEVRLALDYIKN